MSVASNPFALTDSASGNVSGTTVIDAQTGQEVLYDPQNGGFPLVPSIFGTSMFNFDPVCLDVSGAAVCIGYIDPQTMSPLPHLTKGTDKLASGLTQNDPFDPILPGLADAYADLYFLREVASGERKLTDEQEFYLREHAAGIAYTRRDAVAGAFSTKAPSSDFVWEVLGFSDPDTSVQDAEVAGAVFTDATSIVGVYGKWHQRTPLLMLSEGDSGTADFTTIFDGLSVDFSGNVVDPFALSQQRAQNWADGQADREVANYVLKHADRATILRLQLANARIRIRTMLESEARESYLDHTEDIAALAKIDDPAKLAGELQVLSSRIVRGQKLKQLYKAALAVGNSVVYGKRKIDLIAQITKLAKLPLSKQKEFYEGIKKFVADHKIVALAYSLDQLKKIVDAAETAAGKVEHAPPKLSTAERVATAGPGGGRTGVTMASMRSEGTKERNALEDYFGGFSLDVSAARALITKGDVAGAGTAFKAIQADKSFGEMQTRLTAALGFEEGYRYGQKIGIIIVAAAFAAVGGAYVGAAMLARGAPAWLAGLGSLATEAAIFLAAERVGGKLILGEEIFDPKKGIKGNAIHYAGEWVKVMLMFGFLRAGMKTYKGVVDAVVGSRAAKSIVEVVLTKAEKVLKRMNLNPELAGKLARSAKLRAFGNILNHGGAFGAEYTTFTAWDYLIQLHETKGLPKGFFTSKSMVDRLIFLGCLKMGGAAARPFVQPLQAKVMAGQMRRYAGRIDKYNTELQSLNRELVEYDASGKVDFAKITGIHGRMKKLLKKRAGLEDAILKINPQIATGHPEFAEGVKQTKREIKDAEVREKEAAALAIIQSGSYTKRQRTKLMSFLREGVSRKALSYETKRDGTINITFKGQKPISVKLGKRAAAGTPRETAKAVAKSAAVGGVVALGIILDPTFGIFGLGLLGMVTSGKGAASKAEKPGEAAPSRGLSGPLTFVDAMDLMRAHLEYWFPRDKGKDYREHNIIGRIKLFSDANMTLQREWTTVKPHGYRSAEVPFEYRVKNSKGEWETRQGTVKLHYPHNGVSQSTPAIDVTFKADWLGGKEVTVRFKYGAQDPTKAHKGFGFAHNGSVRSGDGIFKTMGEWFEFVTHRIVPLVVTANSYTTTERDSGSVGYVFRGDRAYGKNNDGRIVKVVIDPRGREAGTNGRPVFSWVTGYFDSNGSSGKKPVSKAESLTPKPQQAKYRTVLQQMRDADKAVKRAEDGAYIVREGKAGAKALQRVVSSGRAAIVFLNRSRGRARIWEIDPRVEKQEVPEENRVPFDDFIGKLQESKGEMESGYLINHLKYLRDKVMPRLDPNGQMILAMDVQIRMEEFEVLKLNAAYRTPGQFRNDVQSWMTRSVRVFYETIERDIDTTEGIISHDIEFDAPGGH